MDKIGEKSSDQEYVQSILARKYTDGTIFVIDITLCKSKQMADGYGFIEKAFKTVAIYAKDYDIF